MLEIQGDIWDCQTSKSPICITTNGFVKSNLECVMGRGVALQAKIRYPRLPFDLGYQIKLTGNHVYYFSTYNLITFPTKHRWMESADIDLIARSANELIDISDKWEKIYLVRPGCSNGKLDWKDVKPIIADILTSDKFVIVQN